MIVKRIITILIGAIALSSCINNDIPYPVITGAVLKMEVEGQSELKIDAAKNVVELVLSDTVDLRRVRISSLQVTAESSSTIDSGDVIDLTDGVTYAIAPTPYKFTITTFQDYNWQIVASQPIEREVLLSGGIGKASFDTENRTIVIKVAQSQDLYDITVEKFKIGPSNAVYAPDPYTVCDFSKPVEIVMSFSGMEEKWTVEVEHSFENVVTGKANAWAQFVYLDGDVLPTSTLEPAFEYSEVVKENPEARTWAEVAASNKSGKITGVATGLKPNTEYVFRARLGGEYGAEVTFKTETSPIVPNLGFEDAYQEGITWYFNKEGKNSFWATGNEGVGIIKKSNTSSVSGNEAVKGNAVRMETLTGVPMVEVAAGNLYTGTYQTNMGDPIKSAVMGRPYKGRPTRFSGWYRYTPKAVDAYSSKFNFADSIGKMDWCHIYVTLEKWPDGAEVRPDAGIEIVAHGEFRSNQEAASYAQFSVPIVYNSLTTRPTHIVMTATSSINGGFFCGATGAVLYVDEFELGFDYEK